MSVDCVCIVYMAELKSTTFIFVPQLYKGLLGCGTYLPLEIKLSLNEKPISKPSKYEQYSDITKSFQRDIGKLMRCNCKETCGKICHALI